MTRVRKVAISLPKEVFDWLECERSKRETSRSQLLTRLARDEMYRQELEDRAKRYKEAYEKFPETEEEKAWGEESDRAFWELLDEQEP